MSAIPTSSSAGGANTKTTDAASYLDETKFMSAESSLPLAVIEYRDFPERPLAVLSAKYGVSPSTIVYQARKKGVGGRKRGRPVIATPTAEHQRILDLVRSHGAAEAARRADVSKQYISSLIRRRAPELAGHRATKNIVTSSTPRQRQRRTIVVSFRISEDELKRLKATKQNYANHHMTDFEKARAMVLAQICDSAITEFKPKFSPYMATPVSEILLCAGTSQCLPDCTRS